MQRKNQKCKFLEYWNNLWHRCLKIKLKHLARCSMTKICGEHFHARCLAEYCLHRSGELDAHLFPIQGHCPNCEVDFHWVGSLIFSRLTKC